MITRSLQSGTYHMNHDEKTFFEHDNTMGPIARELRTKLCSNSPQSDFMQRWARGLEHQNKDSPEYKLSRDANRVWLNAISSLYLHNKRPPGNDEIASEAIEAAVILEL